MPPIVRLSFALVPLALAACYTSSADPMGDAERARAAQDWPAVVAALDDGARQGDPYAMAALADVTRYGMIDDSSGQQVGAWAKDEKRSDALYRRAAAALRPLADRGDVRAQLMLGRIVYGGFGVARDTSAATALWARAAAAGDADAQAMLGTLVYMRQRDPRAVPMLTRAAEQGHAAAQYMLYFTYRDGRLVESDPERAMAWLARAAAADHREAIREQRAIAASTAGRTFSG